MAMPWGLRRDGFGRACIAGMLRPVEIVARSAGGEHCVSFIRSERYTLRCRAIASCV